MPGVAPAAAREAGWGARGCGVADALAAPADRGPIMGGSRGPRPAAGSVYVTVACRVLHRSSSHSLMSHGGARGAARLQQGFGGGGRVWWNSIWRLLSKCRTGYRTIAASTPPHEQ